MKRMLAKKPKKAMAMLFSMMAFAFVLLPTAAGASSQAIDFGSGGFTFELSDIMTSAWNFIAGFNTYVILILALIVVPTLIGFVIWLMSKLPRFRKSKS